MSFIVQQTIIDYFDANNATGDYNSGDVVPVMHTDQNFDQMEEGGNGPYVKTFIVEQDYEKIDDTRKEAGTPVTTINAESGVFISQVFVWKGLGDKDLRVNTKVVDAIKQDFTGLYLPTTDNCFIDFGNAQMRQPVEVELAEEDEDEIKWIRLDVLIPYTY
jgi:hypothetical protein